MTRRPTLNRRDFLKYSTILAGTTLGGSIASPNDMESGSDSTALLSDFLLHGFGPEHRLSIWWQTGIRYAQIDAVRIPLHGVELAIFACRTASLERERRHEPKLVLGGLCYHTDLGHRVLLDSFRNPFTHAINSVSHRSSEPTVYTPVLNSGDEYGMLPHSSDNTANQGSDTGHTQAATVTPLPRNRFDLQYTGTDAAVNRIEISLTGINNTRHSAWASRCPVSVHAAAPWPVWLKMKNLPGHVVTEMTGYRCNELSDLPDSFLISARRIHPWIIRDPLDWLNVKIRT